MTITGKQRTERVFYLGRSTMPGSLAVCFLLVLFACEVVWAGSGGVIKLPRGPKPPKSGLRMTVDTNWVAGPGYRPVRIAVTSTTGPVAADRNLFVEISPNDWDGQSGNLYAGMPIEIPEGSAGTVETLLVPQYDSWEEITLAVYEDGVQIKELSVAGHSIASNEDWSALVPNILVVHPDAPLPEDRARLIRRGRLGAVQTGARPLQLDLPDLRAWGEVVQGAVLDAAAPAGEPTDADILEVVQSNGYLELLPPERLPDSWVGLTSLDIIMISMDDLSELKQKAPARFRAIRTAAAAGSVLCVWGVGDKFDRLESLEELLELKPLPHEHAGFDPFRGWSAPDTRKFGRAVAPIDDPDVAVDPRAVESVEAGDGQWIVTADGERMNPRVAAAAPPADRPPFRVRKLGLGTVVAIAADDPFPGSNAMWQWFLASLPVDGWQWYRRHGMSLSRVNDDFWNFLIPGVGLAPVTVFRVLITIFVVVIGPVNYLLLRRWGRLHLLLVTVPAGAMLVITGLFLYAFLADGLGVRARVRSFTLLDQRSRESISWSRQTYYAGLAPSSGLAYPKTSAVYPLCFRPWGELHSGVGARYVKWDDRQRLTGSWLRSRTVMQMMVVQADRSEIGLAVRPGGAVDEPPEITNQLGGASFRYVYATKTAAVFFAENIAVGEVCQPQPVSPQSPGNVFGTTYSENRLQHEDGVEVVRYGYPYAGGRARRYYPYRWYDDEGPPPRVSTSVMERNLQAVAVGRKSLDKRSYLAIVERCESVPLGVQAREELGYHVIKGNW